MCKKGAKTDIIEAFKTEDSLALLYDKLEKGTNMRLIEKKETSQEDEEKKKVQEHQIDETQNEDQADSVLSEVRLNILDILYEVWLN